MSEYDVLEELRLWAEEKREDALMEASWVAKDIYTDFIIQILHMQKRYTEEK